MLLDVCLVCLEDLEFPCDLNRVQFSRLALSYSELEIDSNVRHRLVVVCQMGSPSVFYRGIFDRESHSKKLHRSILLWYPGQSDNNYRIPGMRITFKKKEIKSNPIFIIIWNHNEQLSIKSFRRAFRYQPGIKNEMILKESIYVMPEDYFPYICWGHPHPQKLNASSSPSAGFSAKFRNVLS